jgi:signal transduction histidine kinase/ActR/RegA family two-component response regulator
LKIFGLCFDESAVGSPFTHDRALVALSFIVAAIASYTALELAERLRRAEGRAGSVWHSASSIVLGSGIWAMHFIAMLAFQTPLERGYDLGLTALSAVVAIAVVAVGFWIVRGGQSWIRLLFAGVIVGSGVVAMHYTGMAALRVAGEVYYRPSIFTLSVVIALAACTVALWLAFNLRRWWERAMAAVVMAVAICGMHYTGMAATVIIAGPDLNAGGITVSEPILAAAIALGVVGIVMVGLVGAFYDRQREKDAVAEATRLRQEVAHRTFDLRLANERLDAALVRAERASAAKSDFLASMSHELRTPMNSILGFSQLLLGGRSFEPLAAGQTDAVQQIDHAGRHLLRLIDEILDLAQIEAGRMTMSLESVDVIRLVEDVAAMLQPAAVKLGVTVQTKSSTNVVLANADQRRLHQVLINLVSNAIKYNRRGGKVDISCGVVSGCARIVVSDTGAGIPKRYMSELFEPFNRLGQEQSDIVGSGVGLALCKRLVEKMDGLIHAESEEGVGSVFTVHLPMAALNVARAMASAALARTKILYIEDNPANALLMRHIIKELNEVDLVIAVTGHEGIETARSLLPALILLDINLPDIDGFEVLTILKSDSATMAIPVIALTANAMPREVKRGLTAGFHSYVTKPLNPAQLIQAITKIIGVRDGDSDGDANGAAPIALTGTDKTSPPLKDDKASTTP